MAIIGRNVKLFFDGEEIGNVTSWGVRLSANDEPEWMGYDLGPGRDWSFSYSCALSDDDCNRLRRFFGGGILRHWQNPVFGWMEKIAGVVKW